MDNQLFNKDRKKRRENVIVMFLDLKVAFDLMDRETLNNERGE